VFACCFVYYTPLVTIRPNMNYHFFSAEDFLLDESFKKWLMDPDPATIHFWESWLANHPQKREAVEEAKELLGLIQFRNQTLSEDESDKLWQAILLARKDPRQATLLPLPKESPSSPYHFSYFIRIAAVFFIALSAGALFYLVSLRQGSIQYLTKYGETKQVILPDNSVVTLNGNSKLTVPAHWKHQVPREVWIQGEAFFDIQKKYVFHQDGKKAKARVKFVVHTQNMEVKVLGTAFNVNDRRGKTKVMLQEGQVQLSLHAVQPGAQVRMEPGDMVEVSRQERLVRRKKVDPELYASWKDHKLILNNTPLSEIATTLEDSFGYQVIFKDPAHANRLVRGVLPLNDIPILLEALASSLDLKVTKDKEKLIFESR
jgi:transmembrane sensor